MRYCICLILFSIFNIKSIAQVECGTDLVHQKMLETDSSYRINFQNLEIQIQHKLENRDKSFLRNDENYTIPVVVHVIHLGESIGIGTNISDTIIHAAILGLNDRWKNNIGNGVDMGFEFCLASRDPQNQPTSGINRVNGSGVSFYTSSGITWDGSCGANKNVIKDLSKWPTSEYYNIWVVNKICGTLPGGSSVAGYANYPNGSNYEYDGTVISYQSLHYDSKTLAHEIGHAFFLYHTFESPNSNCPPNNDCLNDGDKVCDTPPHKQNDCDITNPCSNLGIWDNSKRNYMSYCGNSDRFTNGQKKRVRVVAMTNRKSLITSSGCITPLQNDVSLIKINEQTLPTLYIDNCPGKDSITPQIQIQNIGLNIISTIKFRVVINGRELPSNKWNGILATNQIKNIELNKIKLDTGFIEIQIIADSINNHIDPYLSNNAISSSHICKKISSINIENEIKNSSCIGINNGSIKLKVSNHVSILEDFESKHDWMIYNNNNPNFWIIGDKVSSTGVKSAYITYDSINYNFNPQYTSAPNFFKDFYFPIYCENVKLQFDLKLNGESSPSGFAGLLLYIVPSDINILDNIENYKLKSFIDYPNFSTVTFDLSNKIIKGSNTKILFRWNNYLNAGLQPPAAIDNIEISYDLPSTEPYLFEWSGTISSEDQNLIEIPSGSYNVKVTDTLGCSNQKSIIINAPPIININNEITNNVCFGENDGSIKVVPINGVSPYNYKWSNGVLSDSNINLISSVYYLTLTDHKDYLNQKPLEATCTPTTTNYCCNMGIYNVKLNNLNKSSFSAVEGYRDFTSNMAVIEYGQTNVLEVTTGTGYPERVSAWIDYNNDSHFSNQELVLYSENSSPNEKHRKNIIIPDDAVKFTALRLRIMSDNGVYPMACTNLVRGQCEDYSVLIGSPSCSIFSFEIAEPAQFDVNITHSGSLSFCEGNSITLTASNGSSYLWTNGATTKEITVDTSGDYKVTVTDANGCSNVSNITTTIEKPLLTPKIEIMSSSTSVCEGEEVTFNSIVTNGGSNPNYQWFVNNVLQSETTGSFKSKSLTNGAKVFCNMVSNEQCRTVPNDKSNTLTMAVNPLKTPTIEILKLVNTIVECENASFEAKVTSEGSTPQYSWYVNGILSGTGKVFTYSDFNNNDALYCLLKSNARCVTKTDVISDTVVLNVIPLAQPLIQLINDTISSTNYSDLNYTYKWYYNGNEVSNSPSIKCSEYGSGEYYLIIEINECQRTSLTLDIDNCAVAVNEEDISDKIVIYPNPTTGKINLLMNNSKSASIYVRIINTLSKEVFSNNLNIGKGILPQEIDISDNENGMYLMEIKDDDKKINLILIKVN